MTSCLSRVANRRRSSQSASGGWRHLAVVIGLSLMASACGFLSPTNSPTPTATPSPSPTPSGTLFSPSPSPSPTATPAPPLSLDLPANHDARQVRFSFNPTVPTAKGRGQVRVSITNLSSTMIKEIVLRWPTPVDRIVYLAPFSPSSSRLRGVLVVEWTKWVIGPGEMGEPDGTTSVGWGPVLPGKTLSFDLVATRRVVGAVSFDLQLLAGEAVLTQANGAPAEARVTIP
jgi:hypothetical protein